MIIENILYILIALGFSAYFSGMEIAFIASNRMLAELEKERDKNGLTTRVIEHFYNHPNGFVSTMLVGNNITLVIYGILIAEFFNATIFNGLEPGLAVALDTILSTIIVLFTGEFLPKTLFKNSSNLRLSQLAIPTFFFYFVLWPISKFTTLKSHFILLLIGVEITKENDDEIFSKVDLDYLVQSSIDNTDDEDLEPEVELFQNALEFSDLKVRDCMLPRNEVCAVDIEDCSLEELKQKFIESGHSKLVVYQADIDNIIGYIHSSELFQNPENWRERIIEIPFVTESMNAQKLMTQLMVQKKSLAVVVDEYGGTGGIVSLEDIVEEIVGEIQDEHDTQDLEAREVDKNTYLLAARLEIDMVNETFDLKLPTSDEYQTVAGLILHIRESFPELNEVVKIGDFEFTILKKSDNKIERVQLKVNA